MKEKPKEKTFISVVVYVHNAEDRIDSFLHGLDDYLDKRFDHYEIILVDDYSTDNSVEKMKKMVDEIKGNITLVTLAWRHQSELAILAGADLAIGDYIYEIESTVVDYQWDLLGDLFEAATSGYDIVAASPDSDLNMSSKVFYRFLNWVSYLKLDLTTETLRIVTRRALSAVLKAKEKIRYRKALYKYSGFPSRTIVYTRLPGVHINSEKTLGEKLGLAFNIVTSFSNIGLRIAFLLSIIFFFVSIAGGVYAILIYLTHRTVIEGWTTLMLFLSAGFAGLFFVLGVIGKYIAVILSELQNRPQYTVSGVQRLTKS